MFTILVVLALIVLDLVVFSEMDCFGWSAVIFLAGLLGVSYFVDSASAFVVQHGGIVHFVTGNVLWYIGIGIIVAACKWILFNLKVADTIKDLRGTFKCVSESDKYWYFLNHVEEYAGDLLKGQRICPSCGEFPANVTEAQMISILTPNPKFHANRIGAWVIQWPIVILDVLLMDVLMKIGRWVSRLFGSVFSSMSKYLITNATKGL